MAAVHSAHFSLLPFDPSLGSDTCNGNYVSEYALRWFSSVVLVAAVISITWELTGNAKSGASSQTYRMRNYWVVG